MTNCNWNRGSGLNIRFHDGCSVNANAVTITARNRCGWDNMRCGNRCGCGTSWTSNRCWNRSFDGDCDCDDFGCGRNSRFGCW